MTHPGVYYYQKLPLQLVAFVIQIFSALGLVGYLSFKNGQKAVENLAEQLMGKVNRLADQHLNTYFATPHQINQINADPIEVGLINLRDFRGSGRYFCQQIQVFNDIGYNSYALTTGKAAGTGRWLARHGVTTDQTINSRDPTVKATAEYLKQKFGDFQVIQDSQQLVFQLEGEPQFVHIKLWRDKFGLNCLVIVVVPESDFVGEIKANNHKKILLCLEALSIAILLRLYTSCCIANPILRFAQATSAIA